MLRTSNPSSTSRVPAHSQDDSFMSPSNNVTVHSKWGWCYFYSS